MSFAAKFRSECETCDEPIEVGQLVEFVGVVTPGVQHVFCPQPRRKICSICPVCFIEIPTSGVCGVCEE